MQGKARTEEEQSRDPQGKNFGLGSKGPASRTPIPRPAARHSHTGGTCFRMLFITPMKPANNLASSRAASFFSVFFLLHFSTPEAAILRQLGSRPGLAWPGRGCTLRLRCTKHGGRDCSCSALLRSREARFPGREASGAAQQPGGGACALRSRGRGLASQPRAALLLSPPGAWVFTYCFSKVAQCPSFCPRQI